MANPVAVCTKALKIGKLCEMARLHVRHFCPAVVDLDTRLAIRPAENLGRVHLALLAEQSPMQPALLGLFGSRHTWMTFPF